MVSRENDNKKKVECFFLLSPYADGYWSKNLTIGGELTRRPRTIEVIFRLHGNLDNIHWPIPSSVPIRRHRLWQQTCFEIFLSHQNTPEYWEINLSPDGCWNVYHFNSYRNGMREEGHMDRPNRAYFSDGASRQYTFTLDVGGIIDDARDIDLGVSTVLQSCDGSFQYWALVHCGNVPDFHDQRSFSARLHRLDSSGPGD